MRWPQKIFLCPLLLAAWVGAAEDSAPLPLDAARRDLQAMQTGEESRLADPAATGRPAAGISAVVTPPETDAPPPKTVVLPSSKARDDKSHWLLDAMEAQKKGSDALLPGDKSAGQEPSALLSGPNADGDTIDAPSKPPPPAAVVNPLEPFLTQWMTPQDYTLLARPAADGAPASTPAVNLTGAGTSDAPASSMGSDLSAVNDARPNLYLSGIGDLSPAALAPPPSAAPVEPPASPAAPGAAPAETFSVPPPPFALPDDTAKYFPQLKNHF